MRTRILTLAFAVAPFSVALAQAGSDFASVDADNDSYLTMAELQAEYPEFEEAHMALIDTDENQLVDEGEYLNALEGNVIDTVFGVEADVGDGGD